MISYIKITGRMVEGIFRERPNRFLALVNVEGGLLPIYVPNPGRMLEFLTPGRRVILRGASGEGRKTSYDLIGVLYKGQRISVDSRIPNRLVYEALRNGDLEEFSMYREIKPEYGYGHTRFDFLLTDGSERCLLEVKSCTLVEEGRALFPDAVTERGRRHLMDLAKAKREGYRASVLFIVQRTDAKLFSPNDKTDPEFGKALREAHREGIEVYAYYSEFNGDTITLKEKIKVELNPYQVAV